MLSNFITQYRKEGLSIIPVPYKSKRAIIQWAEFQKRLPTNSEIQQWFSHNNTNVAIICGSVSGNLVALDCDSEAVFYELASTICQRIDAQDILDFTRVSQTGRGYQIWLRTKEPIKSVKFPKLDIKGEGGYVVAPPSTHPNGKRYKFVNPDTPIRLIDSLKTVGVAIEQKPETPNKSQPNWVSTALANGVSEGARNDTCLRLAGYFKKYHPQDITERILLDWNIKNRPPLSEREILTTIQSAYSYASGSTKPGLRSLTSIIDSAIEIPRGLWGNFLFSESIAFLSGEAGAGKTTFVYNLAAGLSCGDSYLGFEIPRPLNVLLYDLESPDGLIKARSKLIGQINSNNIQLGRFDDFKTEYKKLVAEGKGFDVIVIDTVSKGFKTMSEDDNAEAREEMKMIRNYARETGACVILLHHMGKMAQGKAVYKARGASARPDMSDVVINFEAINEDIIRFYQAKNRFIGGQFTFFLRKIEGEFERTQFSGYSDSMGILKAQNTVIRILSQKGETPRNDIVETLKGEGFSRATTDRALGNLQLMGKVIKPRYGVYSLSQGVSQ
ncbi:bifunctional DNA primase/polymerase [Chloroflexota bacterium]